MLPKKLVVFIFIFSLLYEGSAKSDEINNENPSPETIFLNDDNENEDALNGPVDTVLRLTDEAKSQNDPDNVKEYQMGNGPRVQPWKYGNSWSSSKKWGGNSDGNNLGWKHWSSWGGNSGGGSSPWGGGSRNSKQSGGGQTSSGIYGSAGNWRMKGSGGASGERGGGNSGGNVYGGTRGRKGSGFRWSSGNAGGRWGSSGNKASGGSSGNFGMKNGMGGGKFGMEYGMGGGKSGNFGMKYGMGGGKSGNFGMEYGMGGGGNAMGSQMGGGQGSESGQSGCIAEDGGWFVIRHSSGKCVLPNDQSIKAGTKIVLGSSDCKNQIYVFVWTAKQSIKHVISGMCITLEGENLVLKKGCDGGANTQFQYIATRKRLMSSGKTVQATQGSMGEMTLVATAASASNGDEATFTFESAMKMNIQFSFTFGMLGGGLEASSTGGGGRLGGGGGLGLAGAAGSMGGGGTSTSGGMNMRGSGYGGMNGGFSGSVSGGGSPKGGAGGQMNGAGRTSMFVIRHQASGMCLYPKGDKKRNIALVLDDKCNDPKAVFQFSSKRSIESVALSGYYLSVRRGTLELRRSSLKKSKLFNFNADTMAFIYEGNCVQPKQTKVAAGTMLVVRKGTFQSWMAFQILVATASGGMSGQGADFFGTTSTGVSDDISGGMSSEILGGMSGKMSGGMSGGTYGAEVPFVIKHSQTGLCFYPKGGKRDDDVQIVLARKCDEREAMFAWTREQTLKSVAFIGFCLHPKKGRSNPDDGTELVIFKGCRGKRLRFTYDVNTMSLKHEISGKYIKPETQNVAEGTGLVIGSEASVGAWMQFKFIAVSGAQSDEEANGVMSGRNHKLIKFGGLKGRKGGRFGMNIGGQKSGSSSSGNGGNFNIQFGKKNSGNEGRGSSSWGGSWKSGDYGGKAGQFGGKGGGGLSSSSSWGGSWKSGGHGGKVDDGISLINGNDGGGVITDLYHTTRVNDGEGKTNGNFDGGVVNEHGGDDNQNVGGNKDVGYGRYSSARNANDLDLNHSDGTTDSEDGDVSIRLDKFLFHHNRNGNGERNYGGHNVGVNSDRTDSETDRENGEIINGHQSAGNTGPSIPNVSSNVDGEIEGGSRYGRRPSILGVNSMVSSSEHQSAGNTGPSIPNVSASVDDEIDGGSRYGKRPSILGVNSMVSSSEKGINDKTSRSNDNKMNDGGFQKGRKSGEFMVGNSQKGSSNEVRLKDDSKTAESGGNNDGMVSKDIGGINDGNAGSRLGAGGNMVRNSNGGRLQDVVTFNHPRGMINVDDSGNPDRIRLDDETVGGKSHPWPPSTWLLGKKNNISRNDGSNNGSTGISHGNGSGTHGHKGLWKWGEKDNITKHHVIGNDSNVGNSEETIMTREDKNGISDQHRIMNGQKKDVTVHRGIEGDRRGKTHHERRKKDGNESHHEKTTVHQAKHSHFKKNDTPKDISGPKESLGKSKKSNKPKKIVKQH